MDSDADEGEEEEELDEDDALSDGGSFASVDELDGEK